MSNTYRESDSTKGGLDQIVRSIVEYSLDENNYLTDLNPIVQFRNSNTAIQKEIIGAKQRLQQINKARTEIDRIESDLAQKGQSLISARKKLELYCKPLGKAAFRAFLKESIPAHEAFDDRINLHRSILALQRKKKELTPVQDSKMREKTMVKAQQLAVIGKIKLLETQIDNADYQIGQRLLENHDEATVECKYTADIISQVVKGRSWISKARVDFEHAQSVLDLKKKQLQEKLGVSGGVNDNILESEYNRCSGLVDQKQRELLGLQESLPRIWLAADGLPRNGQLADLLKEYRRYNDGIDHGNSGKKPTLKTNPMALTGFILGVTAVFLYQFGPIPILAVVFSAIGLQSFKPGLQKNRWMAIVGLVLGIIYTIMYIVSGFLGR